MYVIRHKDILANSDAVVNGVFAEIFKSGVYQIVCKQALSIV